MLVSKRSTVLIAIGMAVFIVGAGLVLVSLHAKGGSSPKKANLTSLQGADVVVTMAPVAAGTTGETLVESGKVRVERLSGSAPATDIQSLAQLQTQSLAHSLPAGSAIQTTDLSASSGPLTVPTGDESVAVTLNTGQASLAGYLQPGQNVDVFSNLVKVSSGTLSSTPCVDLVAPKVEVLDVSTEVPPYTSAPSAAGRSVPSSVTVLLAVSPQLAPKIVFYAMNEQLYLVATDGANPTASNSCFGVSAGSVVPVS